MRLDLHPVVDKHGLRALFVYRYEALGYAGSRYEVGDPVEVDVERHLPDLPLPGTISETKER